MLLLTSLPVSSCRLHCERPIGTEPHLKQQMKAEGRAGCPQHHLELRLLADTQTPSKWNQSLLC